MKQYTASLQPSLHRRDYPTQGFATDPFGADAKIHRIVQCPDDTGTPAFCAGHVQKSDAAPPK